MPDEVGQSDRERKVAKRRWAMPVNGLSYVRLARQAQKAAYDAAYKRTERGRESNRRSSERYRINHPVRHELQQLEDNAKRRGTR